MSTNTQGERSSGITVDAIKALRDLTGAGIMDCRRALEEADGDLDRAQEVLREKGVAAAVKRSDRVTNEGVIESYIHSGNRLGAIVELNCETDFVARTEEFHALAHDLAMQVAAMGPRYLSPEDLSEDDSATPEQDCLLCQPFIKDPGRTVQDLINEVRGRTGENIQVRRFVRYALGQE